MPTFSEVQSKFELVRLGAEAELDDNAVSTGSAMLDRALGVGGLPRGRIVEIFGPEASGKTTLALHCVASAQKAGGKCVYIDVENALDPVYAAAIGVDIDNLWLAQPYSAEEALNLAIQLGESGEVAVIVIDSVAALVPRAELEGDVGDAHVGLQARLMGQALRKMSKSMSEGNTLCIFINQLRERIGVLYGSPEVTPGGRALKFFASVRLDIRARKKITGDGEILGTETEVKVVKNKVGIPFKTAEFDIVYGQGISKEGSLIDLALELGVIEKSGSWLKYEDTKLGQGRENAKQYLIDNEDVREKIHSLVR